MNLKLAEVIAQDLMRFYNLKDWSFSFDRSLTRLGLCSHSKKTISLGTHATTVNTEEQVINTVLHEIAHALVGSAHGHDATWRAKAIELGHSGARCGTIAVKAPSKHAIICHSCNTTWNLYRLTKRYQTQISYMWCKNCGRERSEGKLSLQTVK
jgi:predicted SprT family Zn-dependent metalloprotease